jgi:hypothetical protein
MPDPVTLAAACFGLSITTIELARLLETYIKSIKNAPKDAQIFSNELLHLSHTLKRFNKFLQSEGARGNSFDRTSDLCSAINDCERHLQPLLQELAEITKGKVLQRLKWLHRETEIQQEVQRCTGRLQLFLSMEGMYVLSNVV